MYYLVPKTGESFLGEEDTQASQRSQLSGRRVAERTVANDNEASRSGDNNEDKLSSARVDIKTLAQFLASQQSTHYRLIMSKLFTNSKYFGPGYNCRLSFRYCGSSHAPFLRYNR